ncbi:hypothetical protein [Edaphobacter albus]|uniref:hypothetical protein n=1 Tax=Edaphobacter sp. 4G125 TaxID=2763071 RepID=UPI00164510FF|nr:hypothetical protein [Edaphobacter sp. 4G125]QNI36814.1 hypothetical protein H7846_00230 [Edaphobacter sp. 4G125]
MRITIDNLDGTGARDYSAAVAADGPLKIERTLNAPSRCTGLLDLSALSLPVPSRRARVVVASDAGAVLFTGYLATEPARIYAGVATMGPVHRLVFNAVSDEWLLDKQSLSPGGTGLSQTAGDLLRTLTDRVDAGLFSTDAVVAGAKVGVFAPKQTSSWSTNAGEIANAAYASYRVLNGAVSLATAGAVTHVLSDGDGSLNPAALNTVAVRELANDVTLSGEMEPAAYIAESFAGDGTTSVFNLAEAPYRPTRFTHSAASASSSQALLDSFNQGVLNPRIWQIADPGSFLKLTSAGLTMTGGNGLDGQTTLTAIDPIEMGGTLVVEAGNVQLASPSTGIVCGLYNGEVVSGNCFAGYNVRQSAGTTVVVPFINGAEVGTPFTIQNGHKYTLRMRLHCVETERVLQTWSTMVDGVLESYGGGAVAAPMSLLFELVDEGTASNTPAMVLYSGAVAISPASCNFAVVNSVALSGSVGYCRITQAGSVWIVSTLPGGSQTVRMTGAAGEGVDCMVSPAGRITFFAGRIPVAGEQFTVFYRGRRRSVARLSDAASIARESAGGVPGMAQWMGHVAKPLARSSVDCETAALAVLRFASSRSAAIAGTYTMMNPGADIWPGDVLAIGSGGDTLKLLVRKVVVEDGHARPELASYHISFANDWAESLGLKLAEGVAVDALLPETAASTPANVLVNLQSLQVTSATGTALQMDAGINPPAGGGFEVRRRDWAFGAGVDQDLVLRSPVRSFSIPRAAQVERYYVRMYDNSNPPVYSRFSSAVFTNLPVG